MHARPKRTVRSVERITHASNVERIEENDNIYSIAKTNNVETMSNRHEMPLAHIMSVDDNKILHKKGEIQLAQTCSLKKGMKAHREKCRAVDCKEIEQLCKITVFESTDIISMSPLERKRDMERSNFPS